MTRTATRPAGRRSRKAKPLPPGSQSRLAAHDILDDVLKRDIALDDALAAAMAAGPLAEAQPRDRALARLIVATTLRRLPEIDALLSKFLDRPLPKRSGAALAILRCAVAQIRFLDIAPHAAVGIATELSARDRDARHFKGLVNGVLRNLTRSDAGEAPSAESALFNLPDWLAKSWTEAYGADATAGIAAALLEEPSLDLTVRADPEGWARRLGGVTMANGSVRLVRAGRIEELDGFESGGWWVQDAAASMPARLFGDLAGRRVIDLCAAPGGKTAQLAAAGADVFAVERDGTRAGRLGENLKRLSLNAEIVVADARNWRPFAAADAVLLDAPCSATGIARRHPDIIRRRGPEQIAPLLGLQAALIDSAAEMLKPGGTLVYCTCSLQPEEGENQADLALIRHPTLARHPIEASEVPGFEMAITGLGDLRILPHLASAPEGTPAGSDGFFVARFHRE